MKPRIIVCGLDRAGYRIYKLLQLQGAWVIGMSNTPIVGEDDLVVGNLQDPETLIAAGIHHAETLILALNNDTVNLEILMQARLLNPRVRVISRLFNHCLGDRLDHMLPAHVTMSVSALAAPIFSFAALGSRAIGHLNLFNQTWPIHEEYIHAEHPWLNQPLSNLWEDRSRMLIYYLPRSGDITQDLVAGVLSGRRLQQGDRLIVGIQPKIRSQRQQWWANLGQQFMRLQRFQRYFRSTTLAFLTLMIAILVATLIYIRFSFHQTSWLDALYFSVGLITGAGGQESVAEQSPNAVKLFTILMMLVGAGIVGICYALLNDFVLGTRLSEVWSITRIPVKDHIVVCGLGGLGIQVVQQLISQGHEVVVVEPDANNRFLSSIRSLKIPVIQGEANQSSTLQMANITGARALLAVTSNDIVNLEIALTAKDQAHRLAIVVRSQEPNYAKMVQQVFEFDAVLSPIEIAAPSFAAAALGGTLLGNGMTANILWIAIATLITPAHPFYERRVKDIATTIDLVPLYLENQSKCIHGWELLDTHLQSGSVLYLTLPAVRLEHLLQAQPEKLKV
ncbi:MAG: NAD-binding protein [Synechococcales bacterium]|nr:NAD-binding protein [Synechococcales bacterium]